MSGNPPPKLPANPTLPQLIAHRVAERAWFDEHVRATGATVVTERSRNGPDGRRVVTRTVRHIPPATTTPTVIQMAPVARSRESRPRVRQPRGRRTSTSRDDGSDGSDEPGELTTPGRYSYACLPSEVRT